MIYGLTHSTNELPIQRLTVGLKVSIGIPSGPIDEGGNGKKYPEKTDHFRIVAKNEKGDWVEHVALTTKLTNLYARKVVVEGAERTGKLREFDIVFLQDARKIVTPDAVQTWDIEDIFRTELAWWSATERKCHGNNVEAMRRVSALPKADQEKYPGVTEIAWKGCGDACPQMKSGECKPSGTLTFILKDHPVMGSVAKFSTTSYETIQRMNGSLRQILDATGGRLRGIPFKLVMSPGKTKYDDPQNAGQKKMGTAFFVHVEFRQEDYKNLVQQLISQSVDYARTLSSSKLMLAEHVEDGEVEEVTHIDPESEADEAKTMHREFGAGASDGTTAAVPIECGTICSELGLNPAQVDSFASAYKGKYGEGLEFLTTFRDLCVKHKKTKQEIQELFGRALLQPGAQSQLFKAPMKSKPVKSEPAAATKEQASTEMAPAETAVEKKTDAPPLTDKFKF